MSEMCIAGLSEICREKDVFWGCFWRGVPKTPPNLLYFTVIPKDLIAIALEIAANDKSENFRCSALFCRPKSLRDVQKN
jgi:hypothetical protein